tara:strand:- start:3254 stop:3463 length:210 start_codon:yes stop_codon:yes gene_type:complete
MERELHIRMERDGYKKMMELLEKWKWGMEKWKQLVYIRMMEMEKEREREREREMWITLLGMEFYQIKKY